jgi:flagellar motility protein MotE (MotC chaperone)
MTINRNEKSNQSKRTNVLGILATLLISSALLRAIQDAGPAIAQVSAATTAIATPSVCEPPTNLAEVIAALSTREERLEQQETQLRERFQALNVANQQIEEKLSQLTNAEEQLRNTIALASSAAEDDIARLVKVYETMKPKDAAVLFEEMAPDFAAGFLARMNAEAAAGVLSGLTPEAAYALSVILAGRNANVPRD